LADAAAAAALKQQLQAAVEELVRMQAALHQKAELLAEKSGQVQELEAIVAALRARDGRPGAGGQLSDAARARDVGGRDRVEGEGDDRSESPSRQVDVTSSSKSSSSLHTGQGISNSSRGSSSSSAAADEGLQGLQGWGVQTPNTSLLSVASGSGPAAGAESGTLSSGTLQGQERAALPAAAAAAASPGMNRCYNSLSRISSLSPSSSPHGSLSLRSASRAQALSSPSPSFPPSLLPCPPLSHTLPWLPYDLHIGYVCMYILNPNPAD
jgi:hypothetical protein